MATTAFLTLASERDPIIRVKPSQFSPDELVLSLGTDTVVLTDVQAQRIEIALASYRERKEREQPPIRAEAVADCTIDADDAFAMAMADAFEPGGLDDIGDIAPERHAGVAVACGAGFHAVDPND